MVYKNISRTTKTFYGVKFKPGDVHNVPGIICRPDVVPASESDLTVSKKSESVKKDAGTKQTTKEGVKSNGTDSNQ